jgi:hypothetical protein
VVTSTKEDGYMGDVGAYISYSAAVFVIVLLTGCIVNLLKYHFIFQLAGIAFFFTYSIFRLTDWLKTNTNISLRDMYFNILPTLSGISACLISMVLGFWMFPYIRKKFKS